ncbi:MAG: 30S ribosomal protein S8e [Hadesarchaea archaeon]|nr:30S ribosomal protein S8e [Hadesarchaea archaeon]
MAKWQGKSWKKHTGGRRWPKRKKRKHELGRESAETKIGDRKRVKISARGNKNKLRLLSTPEVHITNPDTGKSIKAKINSVTENPADPHLVRRNIITKGAVIDTEAGKARVTSRPGQSGIVNAVSLEETLEKPTKEKKDSEKETPSSKEESKEETNESKPAKENSEETEETSEPEN